MKHSESFLKLVEHYKPQAEEISIDDLQRMQQQGDTFVLIDVREDHEWEKGHLPAAIHMGRGIIERDIEASAISPQQTIVLYCGGGYRSLLSAANLQFMGYKNVKSLRGGFRGWCDEGLPIEGETK